ncbi:hypothetical protein C2G38_2108649 [Gigaspora rosea]|uniref:Uncharacterized protein n=1 Tax=Gigaspora rosea TaxID=44941 RepID=A0A397UGV1_9GLOM|nr:hypothetical protein C2G38_2108649 [Gigaspora rosea]
MCHRLVSISGFFTNYSSTFYLSLSFVFNQGFNISPRASFWSFVGISSLYKIES